jgi:PAS domain-containing protein
MLSPLMETIAAAQSLLDRQENLAIWHAAYEGSEESILYANPLFCETFDLPLADILERKRYRLVNPPDTPADTIERYKAEDREAIERGYFLQCSPFETGKNILVLKLRFDRGVLGMFKIVDSNLPGPANLPRELDADFRRIIESLRADLLD